jgi:hypothetical protein
MYGQQPSTSINESVKKFIKAIQQQDTLMVGSYMTNFFNAQSFDYIKGQQVNYQRESFNYYLFEKREWINEDILMGAGVVDGSIGTQWSSFMHYYPQNKKVCGSRVFQCVLVNGEWKVAQMIEAKYDRCDNNKLIHLRN